MTGAFGLNQRLSAGEPWSSKVFQGFKMGFCSRSSTAANHMNLCKLICKLSNQKRKEFPQTFTVLLFNFLSGLISEVKTWLV